MTALVLLAEIVIAANARQAGPIIAAPTAANGPVQANIVTIGTVLYGRFLFPFEIAGLILLVAMIEALVLTHRDRGTTRRQSVARQHERTTAHTLALEQVRTRERVTTFYGPTPQPGTSHAAVRH